MGASWVDRAKGWVDSDAAWSAGETDSPGEEVRAVPQPPQSAIHPGPAVAATRAAGWPAVIGTGIAAGRAATACRTGIAAPRTDLAMVSVHGSGLAMAHGASGAPTAFVRPGGAGTTHLVMAHACRVVITGRPGQTLADTGIREVLRLTSPLVTTLSLASFADAGTRLCPGQPSGDFPGLFLQSCPTTTLRLSSPIETEQTTE